MMQISKRELISLDGVCTFGCKHCFSYSIKPEECAETINDVVNRLEGKDFDVVYVSKKRENFIDPLEGITFCEKIFEKYKCHIFVITRNVFNDDEMFRFAQLSAKMKEYDKILFVGISVIAYEKSLRVENSSIPSTIERLEFVKRLRKMGFNPILIVRPLFPKEIIPTSDVIRMIDLVKNEVSSVISSGLIVNDNILERLDLSPTDLTYLGMEKSDYFIGAGLNEDDLKTVDVSSELNELKEKCRKEGVMFFSHTLPALNHIISKLEH